MFKPKNQGNHHHIIMWIMFATVIAGFTGAYILAKMFAFQSTDVVISSANVIHLGSQAQKDEFAVSSESEDEFISPEPDVLGATEDATVKYKYTSIETPLYVEDYYDGKYTNAKAGASEMNRFPILTPGKRIRIWQDGYITIKSHRGYVRSSYKFFGSGVCWTVSALGGLIDRANVKFKAKYNMPLFIFKPRDTAPHGHYYRTYHGINGGKGYAIFKTTGGQDYSFTVNPEVANIPGLADLKLDIVMTATNKYPSAYRGQSIGGYLLTNKEFLTHVYADNSLGPVWKNVKGKVESVFKIPTTQLVTDELKSEKK